MHRNKTSFCIIENHSTLYIKVLPFYITCQLHIHLTRVDFSPISLCQPHMPSFIFVSTSFSMKLHFALFLHLRLRFCLHLHLSSSFFQFICHAFALFVCSQSDIQLKMQQHLQVQKPTPIHQFSYL